MDLRTEILEFRADDAKVQTPPGMLRGRIVVAAPGVYSFATVAGKVWKEYVPPEVLADPEYRASLQNLPLTLEHPTANMLGDKVVTPDNASQWTIGSTAAGEVRADGALEAPAMLWDRKGIEASRTTHKQVSAGYATAYDRTPGIAPNGEAYDVKQIKRIANHVALVPNGLHGQRATFRADSADGAEWAYRVDSGAQPVEIPMHKIKIGDVEHEVPEAVAAHLTALQARADAAHPDTARADKAEGEVAALKAAAAEHEAQLAKVRADALPQARERVALEAQCQAVCGKDWKADGKTDQQCRADALAAMKVEIPASRADSAEYLQGAFDLALASRKNTTTAQALAAGMNQTQHRADSATADLDKVREEASKARAAYVQAQRG